MFPILNYVMVFALVAMCPPSVGEPGEGREAAIAAIKKLGGTIGYHDQKKMEVVKVDLNRTKASRPVKAIL